MAEPDPKPRPRVQDPTAGYTKIRAEQRCRLCGMGFARGLGLTRHHVVPKGQGGDDVADNLVPLCGHGTIGCHGAVEHDIRARVRLRAKLRPQEIAYATRRYRELGKPGGFNTRYPKEVPAHLRRG